MADSNKNQGDADGYCSPCTSTNPQKSNSRDPPHYPKKTRSSMDPQTCRLIEHVLVDQSLPPEARIVAPENSLTLFNLQEYIDRTLDAVVTAEKATEVSTTEGRLGCSEVLFDNAGSARSLAVEPDRLGVSSLSNFSSIRANCCVYKGKWIYELMLGSKGVMQVGWCTINCQFYQENGVGDTTDSYAYDGNRLCKWNVKTQRYGESWLTGDVISCAIDCDKGTITFFRNGKCLGEAFNNVRCGPGYAYFPAVSLSMSENILEGYKPLQDPPHLDLVQAQILFCYLENLLPIMVEEESERKLLSAKKKDLSPPVFGQDRSRQCNLLLVAAHLFNKLATLLKSAYIVEACLLRFMLKVCDAESCLSEQPYISKLLDTMWTLMQDFELKACLENLIITLLTAYRFSPITADFKFPRMYLSLTLAILRHSQTRHHLLSHVLFDKIKFPVFLHIKPPDDKGLIEMVPNVWWPKVKEEGIVIQPQTEKDEENKQEYLASCEQLRNKIEEIEKLQVEMLKVLLTHDDEKETLGKTSRDLFLGKFRAFLKENAGTRLHPINTCPLPVSLCFFHRLIQALQYYWDFYAQQDPKKYLPNSEAYMPSCEFKKPGRDNLDFQRCGGLLSHLQRTLNESEGSKTKKGHKSEGISGTSNSSNKHNDCLESSVDPTRADIPGDVTLAELLDGVVTLYHIATHKQLGKMSALRDNMNEFINSLIDTEEKLAKCPDDAQEIKYELERSKAVFEEKISELARQMAWVIAVIYSKVKQLDVAWIFRVVLKTIEKASADEIAFQFLPEFYVDTCINTYNALKNYFHPTTNFFDIPDNLELSHKFALFLTRHFSDVRIVNSDLRDNITQALACFACFPYSLEVLEDLPLESKKNMMLYLTAPYDNRSWAQTNWILVRIWKGCGFGYRYTHLPHLVPSKLQTTELGVASLQKPCPSKVFQDLLSGMLEEDMDRAIRFLDTMLSQLNWSFSEFIAIMQQIQQVVSKTEPWFIDTRQLKFCATCFQITISLLRVVEMIVFISPGFFTDYSKPSSELLLTRLIQLLCQILNRIATRNGMFENVISLPLPGMEVVTHYPIVAATVGILNRLILSSKGTGRRDPRICNVLLSEPLFQIDSLNFLLGQDRSMQDDSKTYKKQFNLREISQVNSEEIQQVEELIDYLQKEIDNKSKQQMSLKDEDLCAICYANPISVIFEPCGHKSCRNCITYQMMSKKECFYCMTPVTAIRDIETNNIEVVSAPKDTSTSSNSN
ncbi:E3 ubiquitin-protein ligase RNF123-like isoform X2 [Argonauta hians]